MALVATLSIAGGVAASSTVVVRPGDVGASWLASSRNSGSSAFVTGPATALLGAGSLQFTTTGLSDASQVFNFGYNGTPLASFDALGYSTYRSSSSTNPPAQTIALALQVHVDGPGGGVSPTLIFEPIYQNAAIQLDSWQTWDALQGGKAVWWSTKDLPDPSNSSAFIACNPNGANAGTNPACAGKLFIHLSSILGAFPSAVITGGIGPFVGSGWDKAFTGYTDALRIGVSGNTTTYDFEPKAPLSVTAPDVTKAQGDAIPALTPTYGSFVHGDTAASLTIQPTCTTSATAGSPIGDYPITCADGVSANYTFTYFAGTLHVTARAAATPTSDGTTLVGGETATPVRAATPPPTSATGESSSDGGPTPLAGLLICVAFGSLGLLAAEAQRRMMRR